MINIEEIFFGIKLDHLSSLNLCIQIVFEENLSHRKIIISRYITHQYEKEKPARQLHKLLHEC